VTSEAPYIFSTILSEFQYAKAFVATAKASAIIMPVAPPIRAPIAMNIAVRPARRMAVFVQFIGCQLSDGFRA
jgi:hypothetical protein